MFVRKHIRKFAELVGVRKPTTKQKLEIGGGLVSDQKKLVDHD